MTKDEEFRNFISEIKARADCRDIFRRFWPDKYRERGNCACPFHEDREPSMQISEDLAYCHSEGLSLDAIDLYARGANCTRGEAIKQLASELGIQRYHETVRSKPNADYFSRRMQEAVYRGLPEEAMRYLKNRGIEPDIIQRLKAKRLIGWDEKYSAIAFPLYDWSQIDILGIQVIPVDGSKKRFIKGTNSRKAFFRFGYGCEIAVFSEGIINALSIAQMCRESEAVALLSAGMTDKLDGLTFPQEPVLFLDNDEAGRKGAAKVLHRFGAKYRLIDWSIAREVTEGIGKINDANDLLKADQGEIIRKMIETAKVPDKEEAEQIISLYVAKKKSLPSSGENSDEDGKQTQAQLLLNLSGDAEFFNTPEDVIYGSFPVDGHRETWLVRSKNFKRWLSHKFFQDQQKPPGCQAVQDALNVLEARAQFEGPRLEVFMRVARAGEQVYIDLVNDSWDAIEISPAGWRVINPCPVKFRRTRGMLPLPYPERGGSFDELRVFLNLPDEDALKLVIGWIIQSAQPYGPYPILNMEGEQGSAKTFTSRLIRSLIDPSTAPIRTIPREERDLMIAATNAWIVAFDNLSGVPVWLSDALCRLSTGGGFSTRALYSDSEETIFNATRPIILNGIDQIAARHDLADRSIIFNLPPIPEEKRISERELLEKFNAAHPKLLGVICDAIRTGLTNYANTRLSCLPRMADFALWVSAAEPCLPWGAGEFLNAYVGNRKEAVELSLESDPISSAVRELMASCSEWEGTASELLDKLAELIPERIQKTSSWPKKPNGLSTRLRRSATFLRAVGIEIDFYRLPNLRRRIISIRKK